MIEIVAKVKKACVCASCCGFESFVSNWCLRLCVLLLGVSLMMNTVPLLLSPPLPSELTRLLRYSGLILD